VSSSHHDPRGCDVCGSALPARTGRGRSRRYCSRACQQGAYRTRRAPRTDPHARLDDLRTAVAACSAALQRSDAATLAEAADLATRAARALAHAARQPVTAQPVTQSGEQLTTPAIPGRTVSPTGAWTPPGQHAEQPTPNETITADPVTGILLHPAEDEAGQRPPRRPSRDLGDGYELQPPPDEWSARWSLFHDGQCIGHVERTSTVTGRSPRWRAYSPSGLPIAATTAARDGTYRTKRDALVQVALDHRLINERRQPRKPSHAR